MKGKDLNRGFYNGLQSQHLPVCAYLKFKIVRRYWRSPTFNLPVLRLHIEQRDEDDTDTRCADEQKHDLTRSLKAGHGDDTAGGCPLGLNCRPPGTCPVSSLPACRHTGRRLVLALTSLTDVTRRQSCSCYPTDLLNVVLNSKPEGHSPSSTDSAQGLARPQTPTCNEKRSRRSLHFPPDN